MATRSKQLLQKEELRFHLCNMSCVETVKNNKCVHGVFACERRQMLKPGGVDYVSVSALTAARPAGGSKGKDKRRTGCPALHHMVRICLLQIFVDC